MTEIDRAPQAVDDTGRGLIGEAVQYISVITQMAWAGMQLAGLSEHVRATYSYIERCAAQVDALAEQMAGLHVDDLTTTEHHEAAAIMRAVLDTANEMATELDELGGLFTHTSEAHQADYGSVHDAATNMDVPMADGEFYSNR